MPPSRESYESVPDLLPQDKVYKIQVGQKLFKITGRTLSWDGPNFFTDYFQKNNTDSEVLFLDRSTECFEIIYRHMQGYFTSIKDEVEYTTLFTDALFYSLPKLVKFLRNPEFYYINVGGKSFQVPKSLFKNEGDNNNYFNVVISGFYKEIEARILEKKLHLSPYPPTYVPRSAEYFAQILTLLSGAHLEMDDIRRASLIQECRYYRLNNLEQKLIKCKVMNNPMSNVEEISIHLGDISKSGLDLRRPMVANPQTMIAACVRQEEHIKKDNQIEKAVQHSNDTNLSSSEHSNSSSCDDQEKEPERKKLKLSDCNNTAKSFAQKEKIWDIVTYKGPYVDANPRDLIFQLDNSECSLIFNKSKKAVHVELCGSTAFLFQKLFADLFYNGEDNQVDLSNYKVTAPGLPSCASKKNECVRSQLLVLPACVSLCDMQVNGIKCNNIFSLVGDTKCNERVPDFTNMSELQYCPGLKLHIAKSMWKIGLKKDKIMLIAIKAVTYCSTKEYCKTIDFL